LRELATEVLKPSAGILKPPRRMGKISQDGRRAKRNAELKQNKREVISA